MFTPNFLLWLYLPCFCLGLLEERFVTFSPSEGSVPIHNAAIISAADDPVGVHIAVDSLARDLGQITSNRPSIVRLTEANATTPGIANAWTPNHVIIVASMNSSLAQLLHRNDKVDLSDIKGKWETFKTIIIPNPFPGIESGLLIVGSDKRGTMFGAFTLAEQCGQSP